VDVFPSRLLAVVGRAGVVLARVLDEVVLQHAHQDGGKESCEKEHRHAAVDDGEPVNFEVLRQERVAAVLLHAPRVRDRRLLPLHAVAEVHRRGVAVRDVDGAQRVRADVDFDDAVSVVRDVEVHVREEVVAKLGLGTAAQDLFGFADEAPDGQVVVVHLEVVVILDSLSELAEILFVQGFAAQRLRLLVNTKADVVRAVDEPVAFEHLTEVFGFVLDTFGRLAERQVEVLVRFRRVWERPDFVGVERHGFVYFVRVLAFAEEGPPRNKIKRIRVHKRRSSRESS